MINFSNIHVIECGALSENAYLVTPDGRQDAFIVDPGDDLAALTRNIDKSGRKLTDIFLTHGHFDHMLAAQPLSEKYGAKVWIHACDMEMLSDPVKSEYTGFGLAFGQKHPEGLEASVYADTVESCGEVMKILHTPGHTKGSVCLLDELSGIMFSGDTLFDMGFGRTDLYGGSAFEMRKSLRTLLALNNEIRFYPGHGECGTIGTQKQRYGIR